VGSIAIVSRDHFGEPSTKAAKALLEQWGKETPTVVIALPYEVNVEKSFRNLERVVVLTPSELEVSALVWARSLVITEPALDEVVRRAR
jgi:ribosomal protein L4